LAVVLNAQGNIYSLEVEINRQGIWVFPWQFLETSKEMAYFLECFSFPPRKITICLSAVINRQGNCCFLGCLQKHPRKLHFFLSVVAKPPRKVMKLCGWKLFYLSSSCHGKLRLNFSNLKFKFRKWP
jgi:hypothetical protein